MNKIDPQFIQMLREGNEDALVEIYKLYRNDFINWSVKNYSCSEDEAKDVFQDTVIILYQNILNNKFKVINSELKTYLFAIGKFKLLNLLKKSSKQVTLSYFELINGIEPNENAMYEKYDDDHLNEIVKMYLSQQCDDCRQVLEMYYFKGMDMKSIAEEMGYKNADVAKRKKYKCFKKLAEMIKDIKNLVLL